LNFARLILNFEFGAVAMYVWFDPGAGEACESVGEVSSFAASRDHLPRRVNVDVSVKLVPRKVSSIDYFTSMLFVLHVRDE